MMNVKILGTGCANCKKLEKNTIEAINNLNIKAEIEKVTDIKEIYTYNILSTPALVVDGKVVFSGMVKNVKDIEEKLKDLV